MSKFLSKILNNDKIYYIISVVFILLSALLITEFIQYRGGNGLFFRWQPVLFIISTVIILFILIIISAICNNVFLGSAVMGAIIFLFTFADRAKWDARGEHIIPSDFITATNLSGMSSLIDYGLLAKQ